MSEFLSDMDSVTAVHFILGGGKVRVRLEEPATEQNRRIGSRWGEVLDDAGNQIGDAHDYIYGNEGWCVSTLAYGGFVPRRQVVIVNAASDLPNAKEGAAA